MASGSEYGIKNGILNTREEAIFQIIPEECFGLCKNIISTASLAFDS